MWEWLVENGIWILVVAAEVWLIIFLGGRWFYSRIKKLIPGQSHKTLDKGWGIATFVIESIALLVFILSLVLIIISQEGVAAAITLETVQQWFLDHGIRIFIVLILGVAFWIALDKFMPPLLRHTMVRTRGESKEGIEKRRGTLHAVFMGIGRVIVVISVIFLVLDEFNVAVGPMLAGLGVAGLAVGFGAQYLIRDLIAGIFIIFENQYRVGDVAKVADVSGLVEEIGLRKTVLRDLDGIVHHVPNGEIRVASNYTRHFARVNLDISVAYSTNLDHAIDVINRVGRDLVKDDNWGRLIITNPEVLRVDKLGDSGIVLKIVGDVRPMQQWAVMGELRKRIKKTFDEERIEIPLPHVKLYVGQGQSAAVTCKACYFVNLPGSKFCAGCGIELDKVAD